MDSEQAILTILAALFGGGAVSFITARATAAQKVSEAAGNLAEYYDKTVKELKSYQQRQARYIRYLLNGIGILSDQVVSLGDEPRWVPEDIDTVCPMDDA